MSRYNPLYFYVHWNKTGAEEGNPVVYIPIGQAMSLMASVMFAPTALMLDTVFGHPDQASLATTPPITQEEKTAIVEAVNRENWEAGYRALEGCLQSKNGGVREYCLSLLNTHPKLKVAAKAMGWTPPHLNGI